MVNVITDLTESFLQFIPQNVVFKFRRVSYATQHSSCRTSLPFSIEADTIMHGRSLHFMYAHRQKEIVLIPSTLSGNVKRNNDAMKKVVQKTSSECKQECIVYN